MAFVGIWGTRTFVKQVSGRQGGYDADSCRTASLSAHVFQRKSTPLVEAEGVEPSSEEPAGKGGYTLIRLVCLPRLRSRRAPGISATSRPGIHGDPGSQPELMTPHHRLRARRWFDGRGQAAASMGTVAVKPFGPVDVAAYCTACSQPLVVPRRNRNAPKGEGMSRRAARVLHESSIAKLPGSEPR